MSTSNQNIFYCPLKVTNASPAALLRIQNLRKNLLSSEQKVYSVKKQTKSNIRTNQGLNKLRGVQISNEEKSRHPQINFLATDQIRIVQEISRVDFLDRETIKRKLMNGSSQEKTIQEKALDYLQTMGPQVKKLYQSTTKKLKQISKSPQTQTTFNPSLIIEITGQPQVSTYSNHFSMKNSEIQGSDSQEAAINHRKMTGSSILKLQHCSLIDQHSERNSTAYQSSQHDQLYEQSYGKSDQSDHSLSPHRYVKDRSEMINLSLSENCLETQSNSPISNTSSIDGQSTPTSQVGIKGLKQLNAQIHEHSLCDMKVSLIPQEDTSNNKIINQYLNQRTLKQISISPEKLGYKKEQSVEAIISNQQSFKAIRKNLLNLVRDLDCEDLDPSQISCATNPIKYEKIQTFKINLKKAN